jgi:hypothetical protein
MFIYNKLSRSSAGGGGSSYSVIHSKASSNIQFAYFLENVFFIKTKQTVFLKL